MNLVEKINQVKIKADTRISGADRAFCERQQRAYDAAREALKELDFTWTDCISQQKMILDGEQAYTYYLGNDRNLKAACFRDELERLHEHFINRLTSYFAHTYIPHIRIHHFGEYSFDPCPAADESAAGDSYRRVCG